VASPVVEYFQRLGCTATFLFALALFFAFGVLATLFNGDLWGLLQSIFLTALCIFVAIYFVRRHRRGEQRE
jgi:hypothetical protein